MGVSVRAISWAFTIYYKPNDNDDWPAALTADALTVGSPSRSLRHLPRFL